MSSTCFSKCPPRTFSKMSSKCPQNVLKCPGHFPKSPGHFPKCPQNVVGCAGLRGVGVDLVGAGGGVGGCGLWSIGGVVVAAAVVAVAVAVVVLIVAATAVVVVLAVIVLVAGSSRSSPSPSSSSSSSPSSLSSSSVILVAHLILILLIQTTSQYLTNPTLKLVFCLKAILHPMLKAQFFESSYSLTIQVFTKALFINPIV